MSNDAKPAYFSVCCISAAALAYEILLIRLFSIIHWHHYAQLIISLALLGYGISGTFLSFVAAKPWSKRSWFYFINLALFSLTTIGCYSIAQNLPFNPQELMWDSWQPFILLALYIFLSIPFFFAANSIGITFILHREHAPHIYAADLLGASFGSIFIIIILWFFQPSQALYFISTLGFFAVLVALLELWRNPYAIAVTASAVLATVLLSLFASIPLNLSAYKDLTQALRITGTHIINERSSPLGLIQVAENPLVPFRHAPGLSIVADSAPENQLAMFIDGGSMTAIDKGDNNLNNYSYLNQMSSALPYQLGSNRRALLLGIGGGSPILQARYNKIESIDAVEPNNQIIELLQNDLSQFSGDIFNKPNLTIFNEEIRGFVNQTHASYDVIQMSALNSFGASSAGLFALSEGYNLTVEAFKKYFKMLSPQGKFAMTLWAELPPKKNFKLLSTVIEAINSTNGDQARNRIALIRNWQTSTLIIKNGPINDKDILAIKDFCNRGMFDLAYYPGMPKHEANRYNILNQAYYYEAVAELLGPTSLQFMQKYKYDIYPATDDKPFADHYFKWSSLPELFELTGKGGMALIQWGYIVLVVALLQALLIGIALILVPLMFKRVNNIKQKNPLLVTLHLTYFMCLGLAFLFIEIVFIQKFILFLSYPVYSSAVILLAFLFFAGLGSMASRSLLHRYGYRKIVISCIFTIALLSFTYLFLFDFLFSQLASLTISIKIAITAIIVAPLAFCMGIPFPMGLKQLGETMPDLIPWVWGVNGFASVISAILASLLAIHFGFSSVIVLAVCIYGIAAYVFNRLLYSANSI